MAEQYNNLLWIRFIIPIKQMCKNAKLYKYEEYPEIEMSWTNINVDPSFKPYQIGDKKRENYTS